jgi:hypothetical protein
MVFRTLLCGECYENISTQRRTNYPSFTVLIVCTILSVNIFVTLSEYRFEALLKHPALPVEVTLTIPDNILYILLH